MVDKEASSQTILQSYSQDLCHHFHFFPLNSVSFILELRVVIFQINGLKYSRLGQVNFPV